MQIITLYNHKGGVSKTTTTFNLGHILASTGKKVVLVDADPQCNLSDLFMAPYIDSADEKSEQEGAPVPLRGTSILDALQPRFSGETSKVDVGAIELVPSPYYKNISLLRGDIGLNAAEDDLSQAHTQRHSATMHYKFTYIAIYDMIVRLAARENADYVMIDVGPSAGSITRTCFLACDSFYVPVIPDRFSVQAIRSLSSIIDTWITEHHTIIREFRALKLNVPEGKPYFLGAITQNYKVMRGNKPRPGYQFWMSQIPKTVRAYLLPVLEERSMKRRNLLKVLTEYPALVAARITDFQTLATVMQECAKPVYDISQDDTRGIREGDPYSGSVWMDMQARMRVWRRKFQILARRIYYVDQLLSEEAPR